MEKGTKSGLISGVSSGSAFIVFTFILKFPVMISVVGALLILLGVSLLTSSRNPRRGSLQISGLDEGMADFYAKTLEEGIEKIRSIRLATESIAHPRIRSKAEAIVAVAEKIVKELRRDPKEIKLVRSFFSYYLEATRNILHKYADISRNGESFSHTAGTVERVENVLGMINNAFELQLGKLLENDVMDLDTEIAALETIMKSEGFEA